MTRSCHACRFWNPDEFHEVGEKQHGECRRRSPVATGGMMSDPTTIWPRTALEDWCGDGQPRFIKGEN